MAATASRAAPRAAVKRCASLRACDMRMIATSSPGSSMSRISVAFSRACLISGPPSSEANMLNESSMMSTTDERACVPGRKPKLLRSAGRVNASTAKTMMSTRSASSSH